MRRCDDEEAADTRLTRRSSVEAGSNGTVRVFTLCQGLQALHLQIILYLLFIYLLFMDPRAASEEERGWTTRRRAAGSWAACRRTS